MIQPESSLRRFEEYRYTPDIAFDYSGPILLILQLDYEILQILGMSLGSPVKIISC